MKGNRYILLLTIVLAGFGELLSQQVIQYSQYPFNKYIFNPAHAGHNKEMDATLIYRNHLMGFPGAPVSQMLMLQMPIQTKFIGIGFKMHNKTMGHINQIHILGTYSYHLSIKKGKLSIGIDGGAFRQSIAWESLDIGTSQVDDPAIPTTSQSITIPDMNFGAYYSTKSSHFGFSITHLIGGSLRMGDVPNATISSKLAQHYYFDFGVTKTINRRYKITPSVLLKSTKNIPWQFDLGGDFSYRDFISFGAVFRTDDAMIVRAKANIGNHFAFSYSYDIRLGSFSKYAGPSHEVSLHYRMRLEDPTRQRIVHPRYYIVTE